MKLLIFQPLIERRYYSYITRREFWPQAAFWVNVQKLLHAISRYSGFKAKLCKTLLYSVFGLNANGSEFNQKSGQISNIEQDFHKFILVVDEVEKSK